MPQLSLFQFIALDFQPHDANDVEIHQRLLSFTKENGDSALGHEIAGNIGHIVAQTRIENRGGTKILLVFSSKEGRWKFPDAHVESEPRQTAMEAASRALGRDAGIPDEEIYGLSESVIPEYWSTPAHTHFELIFRFVADETEDLPRGARWVPIEEVQP